MNASGDDLERQTKAFTVAPIERLCNLNVNNSLKPGCNDVNEDLCLVRRELKSIEGNVFLKNRSAFAVCFAVSMGENPKYSCQWLSVSWKAGHIAHDYFISFQSSFAQWALRGRMKVRSLLVPSLYCSIAFKRVQFDCMAVSDVKLSHQNSLFGQWVCTWQYISS